ncbi:MAG: thioredoxin domain-containing protein [Opitutales bacterium]|nr:thioredoxin domain-containing protein [Opitutales bacterium]
MPNKLNTEKSPYLLQHSNQEIDWMTWSPEALEKASKENKPLLISIGYSACHWCQTMSRQNFEDSYIASLMNRHFVCVLVDREERPDLDHFYMEAIRMFNQSAGWPLHAFCLPNGEPFWGGTFFPKEDMGQGLAPWPQVLIRISEHFRTHPDELTENASNVMKNLAHGNHAESSSSDSWNPELLIDAVDKICTLHDDEFGGFSPAPKFPASMKIDFLLAALESEYAKKNPLISEKVNHCVVTTLDNMAHGGIFDQVEGGFFRYSVDPKWSVPHFEKMLLENSLLLSTYARAFRKYGLPRYKKVVQKTLAWLFQEMGKPCGGFSSSISAESENTEGKFYTWTEKELNEILGTKCATQFMANLEVINGGNAPLFHPRLGDDRAWNAEVEENILPKLSQARSSRQGPAVDEKRMISANAILIRALIDCSIALKDKALLEQACVLADWMKRELQKDKQILPITYPGHQNHKNSLDPILDDFAFWAESLLHLASVSEFVRPNSSPAYIDDAAAFAEHCMTFFRDDRTAGYYLSSFNAISPPPVQKKYWYDNASPSGNSSLLRTFSQLYQFTKNKKWEAEYLEARSAFPNLAKRNPEGVSYALTSITEETVGLVKVTAPNSSKEEIFDTIGTHPYRPIIYKFTNTSSKIEIEVKEHIEEVSNTENLMKKLFG